MRLRHCLSLMVLFGSCMAAPGGQVAVEEADRAVLSRLAAVAFRPDGWRIREELAYDELVAALEPALRVWARSDPYAQIDPDVRAGRPQRALYDVVKSCCGAAAAQAPTDEARARWWRTGWGMLMRVLRAPETQRRYRECLASGRDCGTETEAMVSLLYRELTMMRHKLCLEKVVGSDEWAALVGATWHDSRGDVLWKDGTAHVNVSILGPEIEVARGAQSVALRIGKRELRMAFGIRGRLQKSAASAMPGGKVYVPAEELDRRGLCEARVYKQLQLVVIRPYAVPAKEKAR